MKKIGENKEKEFGSKDCFLLGRWLRGLRGGKHFGVLLLELIKGVVVRRDIRLNIGSRAVLELRA